LKSGSLNLLEPSGPVKACNGIALPAYPFRGYLIIAVREMIVVVRAAWNA
jgi:hypothetical protein